jgi:hypothetical protein
VCERCVVEDGWIISFLRLNSEKGSIENIISYR